MIINSIQNYINNANKILFAGNTDPNILRFKKVDNFLYRGGKPTPEQINNLKKIGVTTIIDFSTGYGTKPSKKNEKDIVEQEGMEYVHLPFPSFENPSQEYLDKFFDIIDRARKNKEKVFIHCTHGKDRTGLFSAMYQLKYGLKDINSCIDEMYATGHDDISNPNLVPFLKEYAKMLQQGSNINLQPSAIYNKSMIKSDGNAKLFVDKFLNEKDPIISAQILLERYPELYWLTGDMNSTPEWKVNRESGSISEALFGQKHIEFDRTIGGINCLKYVINNDYDSFVQCQKNQVKLSRENYKQLRDYTISVLQTPEDIDAMLVYTVINDLGKNKEFVAEVERKSGIKAIDHDQALLLGLKTKPEMIHSFNRLPEKYKTNILEALGANFNLAQFVQAECLEGNLSEFKDVGKDARDFYFIHTLYDVAGAAAHVNPNGSLVMTNPVYRNYAQGIESVKELGTKSENEVYDLFLNKKAEDYNLKINSDEDRSIVKLLVMARASSQQDVEDIQTAFKQLSYDQQLELIQGLSKDGIKKPGILLYYAPAFMQNAVNAKPNDKINMLKKAFEMFTLIYKQNKDVNKNIEVISLLNAANAIKNNPDYTSEELYEMVL